MPKPDEERISLMKIARDFISKLEDSDPEAHKAFEQMRHDNPVLFLKIELDHRLREADNQAAVLNRSNPSTDIVPS